MNLYFRALVLSMALLMAPAGRVTLAPIALDVCPTVSVICPDEIPREGRTYLVTLRVAGVDPAKKLSYKWSVSKGGEIVDGQGTHTVKIRCTHPEESLTATVEVGGLPSECGNIASCSFPVS